MIQPKQIWRDLDYRSYYDTLPDGTYPVPAEYEGRLDQQPRLVEVIEVDDTHVRVRSLHNQRVSRIRRESFRLGDRDSHAGIRHGFVLYEDER